MDVVDDIAHGPCSAETSIDLEHDLPLTSPFNGHEVEAILDPSDLKRSGLVGSLVCALWILDADERGCACETVFVHDASCGQRRIARSSRRVYTGDI